MAYMRFLERVSKILSRVGMGVMVIMMAVVTLNVLGRAIARTPIYGTVEIVELSGAVMVSLIFAYTQVTRQTVIVSIVTDRMSTRLRQFFDLGTMFLSIVFVGLMVWTSGVVTSRVYTETTTGFEITTLPFRLIFLFGTLVLFAVLAGQFLESVIKVVKKWTP